MTAAKYLPTSNQQSENLRWHASKSRAVFTEIYTTPQHQNLQATWFFRLGFANIQSEHNRGYQYRAETLVLK
jgi:hypothetical protein